MPRLLSTLPIVTAFVASLAILSGSAFAADISAFVGSFKGSAEVDINGQMQKRDLSVDIAETRQGFSVDWTTTTYRADGRVKEASYEIDFVPSDRDDVFAAAMKRNVFGHSVPLDPMKGQPYVWGRISGETLTVYSLFVDDEGGYEIQEFNRTLAEGGLDLQFQSVRNGALQREITAFLELQ